MSIKKHSYYVQNQQKENLVRELYKLKKNPFFKENPSLAEQFQTFITTLNQQKTLKNSSPQKIEGYISTFDEIQQMIEEVTQSKNWKPSTTELLDHKKIQFWKEFYNIDFNEINIPEYSFSKKTSDRNASSYISIICFPNYFQLNINTDRVGYSIESLLTKKEFLSHLQIEISD